MQPQFASAGEATEKSGAPFNAVGLYRNESNGLYIGCLEPAAADAVIRQGYALFREGSDAARMGEAEIEAAFGKGSKPAPADDKPAKGK